MMGENEMLYCLIAFILGYLLSRHMGNRIVRNGFTVDATEVNASQCWTNIDTSWFVDPRPSSEDDCNQKQILNRGGGDRIRTKWTDKKPDSCYVPYPNICTDCNICTD